MVKIRVKDDCSYTVKDIQDRDDLIFVDESQNVRAIKEHFGNASEVQECDAFFVKIEDGEYTEVYCMEGIVPYLDKTLCKIWIEVEE